MSPRSHRSITARISKDSKCRVFALDYRLAPESIFPGAIEDAVAAYSALIGHAEFESTIPNFTTINPKKIFIAGDSSGGCLSLQLLLCLRELGLPQPAGVVLISPFVDHECNSDSWRKNWDSDFMSLDYKGVLWALSAVSSSCSYSTAAVFP